MFVKAKAVFPKEAFGQMNLLAVFQAETDSLKGAQIRICAADFYQLYVNGTFVSFGPARTAKGYARRDVISLESYHRDGNNVIVILVAAYNCHSLSTVRQDPFLMAEVIRDSETILWTGRDFDCWISPVKQQKTERYSVQRHFCEDWDFTRYGQEQKVTASQVSKPPVPIARVAPYPIYRDIICSKSASSGNLSHDPTVEPICNNYSFQPSQRWGRFEREQILHHSYEWVQCQRQDKMQDTQELPIQLGTNQYAIFDFSRIETGFVQLCAMADVDTQVVIAFSEDASPDRFEFTSMCCHNVIDVTLKAGEQREFMSFEPYVMRYAMVAVVKGDLTLDRFGIKTFENDISSVPIPPIQDETLRSIYAGAIRTYAHNAVDVYTDCPSRERAGWLCDSYFTAKTEYAMFGTTFVEDAFLENYRLYRNEGEYPEGVLPMCFPSDAEDAKKFIPQWTMWYILEVAEYILDRGHTEEKELFRESVFGLLDFYKRYENGEGLLERLPSWNFLEWSRANDWTQDVNYPTNFLYAAVLESVYKVYGDKAYLEKAEEIREKTIAQSFNGHLFRDHAVRNRDGVPQVRDDCSEVCQYYAILFGGIDLRDPQYSELKHMVLHVFSAERDVMLEEIEPINAFIGVYLRMEALLKMKEYRLVLQEVCDFFGSMENLTGTLWEYRQREGSRDHGFASYVLIVIQTALEHLTEQ